MEDKCLASVLEISETCFLQFNGVNDWLAFGLIAMFEFCDLSVENNHEMHKPKQEPIVPIHFHVQRRQFRLQLSITELSNIREVRLIVVGIEPVGL